MNARSGLQFAANPREFDRFSGLPKYGADLSSDEDEAMDYYDDDEDKGGNGGNGGSGGGGGGTTRVLLQPSLLSGLHKEYGNGPGVVEKFPHSTQPGDPPPPTPAPPSLL